MPADALLSVRLERALRRAAVWHHGQTRKASGVPYLQHPMAVAWILDRLGFAEPVLIAALLHDVVEDTAITAAQIEAEFGAEVRSLVEAASEVKRDTLGAKRSWEDRKRDHLLALAEAPIAVRAIVLADKLHNLLSIQADLAAGARVWDRFNASRDRLYWYYSTLLLSLGREDSRLQRLAHEGARVLDALAIGPAIAVQCPPPGP